MDLGNPKVADSSNSASPAVPSNHIVQDSPVQGITQKAIRDAVERSAELLLLGLFNDALSSFAPFEELSELSANDAVAIARAKARVLTSQGYPRLAQKVLLEIQQAFDQSLNEQAATGLYVHLAFVTIVGCGEGLGEDALLERAQGMLDKLHIEEYDDSSIEMQGQLDKITFVKQTLNRLQSKDHIPEISKRLDPLIQQSRKLRNFHQLWILLAPYLATKSNEDVVIWLKDVLSDTDLPRVLYAHFGLELAKRLIETPSKPTSAQWLENADAAFEEVGHAFGRLEIQRLRLQHGLEKSPNTLQELVNIIVRYMEANYPVAVLQSAISPLTLAFNKGDLGLYINLQEVFHNVCKETDLKLEGLLLKVQLLAALNTGTGHYATVIQLGKSLYMECIDLKYWSIACMTGRTLSLAYNMHGNNQEALEIAEELYELSERKGLEACSEMAYHLAFIRGSKVSKDNSGRIIDCLDNIKFLTSGIEADIKAKNIKLACEKLSFIAGLLFEIGRLSREEYQHWKDEACVIIDRIKALAGQLDGNEKVMTEGNCDEMICTQLLFEGNMRKDFTMELEGLEVCTRLIELYGNQHLEFHMAVKYEFRGLFYQQMYKKEADFQKKMEHLVGAEKDFKYASDKLQEIGFWQQALVAGHLLARIHVTAWDLIKISPDFVMDSLRHLESIADHERQELATFGGLAALLQKQKYSGTKELQDLYNWAISVSALSNMQHNLLVWSQKRKARSLSEVLGLGIMVPANVKEALRGDPSTAELFDELQSLRFASLGASPQERTYIMQRVEDCERKAQVHPVFNDFLALRDGVVSHIDELGVLQAAHDTAKQKQRLIFVDWVARTDSVYLVSADASSPQTTCRMHLLPINPSEIRDWITKHFQTEELRKECLQRDSLADDSKPLRSLDVLISPLRDVSQPGDLLLLSTTAILSVLPLHVLRIDRTERMPLIERNPIVYVPSLPIAKICASRVVQDTGTNKSLFFGVFDKQKEAKKIYNQMDTFATKMQGQSFCDEAATKKRYMAEVTNARLIHHHMHCIFSADNILKQAIVLASQNQGNTSQSDGGLKSTETIRPPKDVEVKPLKALQQVNDSEGALMLSTTDSLNSHLTVEEIFNLVLNSPLVVLIACESASQTVSEGDEPLGLITGYLCAGAASIIGASWPIPSNAGRQFSEKFYQELLNSRSDVINLASALQEAVLLVRDDESTLSTYDWGAFCLYGAWLFHPSWSKPDHR